MALFAATMPPLFFAIAPAKTPAVDVAIRLKRRNERYL
jgi:hypothetical protein